MPTADLTPEQIQAKLSELETSLANANTALATISTESQTWKQRAEEAFKDRDNLKKELQGKTAGNDSEAAKTITALQSEIELLQKENEGLKNTNTTLTDKVVSFENMTRTNLMEQLPENVREDFKDFPLDQLRVVAKRFSEINNNPTTLNNPPAVHRGGSTTPVPVNIPWGQMSREQQKAFLQTHNQAEINRKMAEG